MDRVYAEQLSRADNNPMSVNWIVWLDDGTTRNSRDHKWEDVPDRVIAVKAFHADKAWQLWDQIAYGEPGTWKEGVWTDNPNFELILAEMKKTKWPPE